MADLELPEGMVFAMHGHAARLRRTFPMVEHDDIVQEMWLWALSHTRKLARYIESGDDLSHRKLSRALRNAGLAYCHREKARRVGYDVDDLFFYSLRTLRELLPAVYDPEAWVRLGTGDSEPNGSGKDNGAEPDRRMGAIAALTDVSVGLKKLPADSRTLLEWTFRENYTPEQIAGHLGTTVDGGRMRVQRALRRLQEQLGGDRPDWYAAQRGTPEEADDA